MLEIQQYRCSNLKGKPELKQKKFFMDHLTANQKKFEILFDIWYIQGPISQKPGTCWNVVMGSFMHFFFFLGPKIFILL